MPFRVSGRNLDIGEALRNRMNARVAEAMAKYFDGGYSGHVRSARKASASAPNAPFIRFRHHVAYRRHGADAYASADQAALRIEKRLRRYKRRLKGRATARTDQAANERTADAQSYVIAAPDHETEEEVADFNPVIIAESTTTLERLSVSEAVLELDMTGAPVVVFRHCVNGRVNIVYRRGDGNVGWVDPPAANGQG